MSDATERKDGGLSPLAKAMLSIERLQSRVRELESERWQPIAVLGIGCRLPGGATDPDRLFELLRNGHDAIVPAPAVARDGWEQTEKLPPAGYLQEDLRAFDAPFFGISPREAVSIDPQHRLVLECTWEALERAGIDPHSLHGSRSGVFVGMAGNDYANLQLRSERMAQLLHSHFASGTGHSMVSGRISYLLGLHGPSVTIDTACSSSLVALHLACQSLRTGESDLGIAAGVNLILTPDYTVAFDQARMLAPDGRCKTFDGAADGFSRAEGCGVVVLKRLADAQREGDPILAVIRGSAVNQDGPSSGLTAPNGPAQSAVIRAALRQAGLEPRDLGYVEAHGTGTSLGDPIEVQALGEVFNDDRDAASPLLVGSIKTNVGHLEAAAGIAGFIKLVESVRRGEIPPHLHFRTPSPHIPWSDLKLAVPTSLTPFPVTGGKRRGSVSSFGFSGTNVHVIVEEPPAAGSAPAAEHAGVLALSATDEPALRALAAAHAAHLRTCDQAFADVCHTSTAGRAAFHRRLGLVASSSAEAASLLEGWLAGESNALLRLGQPQGPDRPSLAFLFTGQGSQYAGMGRALLERSTAARRALEVCDEILRAHLEVPLLELLDPKSAHSELVNRTDYTQPALFALQYALTEFWRARGIAPSVVAGHSIGEYAAAHLAGVFSLEDALRLVALRGRLMQDVREPGRMEAVMTSEARVRDWVEAVGGAVSIAGINADDQTVVSGALDAVEAVVQRARAEGVTTRALRTSQAFHSPLMDGAAAEFRAALAGVNLQPGRRLRFVSTLTGAAVAPERLAEPDYWASQLRQPVRFADAARALAELAGAALELGPHPALAALVAQNGVALPVFASLQRERDEWTTLSLAHRDLFIAGASPNWKAAAADAGAQPRRVLLPTYPFQRMPLWVDLGRTTGRAITGGHPLLGVAQPQPGRTRAFERTLSADAPAFIGEHRVLGRVLLPGTAMLEMALAAARELGLEPAELRDVDLVETMVFAAGEDRRVHCRLEPEGGDEWRFQIHSASEPVTPDSTWTLHAAGHIGRRVELPAAEAVPTVHARCPREISGAEFHAAMAARGYDFGPRLGGVRGLRVGTREVLADVSLPQACSDDGECYVAHPLVLDAGLQTVSSALDDAERAFLPMALGRVAVTGALEQVASVHARITEDRHGLVTADVAFLSPDGTVLGLVERAAFKQVAAADLGEDPLLELRWVSASGAAEAASLAAAADTAPAALRELARHEDTAGYDAFVDVLEAESAVWVRRALAELGWSYAPGTMLQLDDVARDLEVSPARVRLLSRTLDILAEEGVLERNGNAWRVLTPLQVPAEPQPLASTETAAEHVLLRRCGPHLAAGMRGTIDPLELLFPGGDGSVAESMYYDAPFARILNGAVAAVLAERLAELPAGGELRVLEVGGGTAGTTRRVVDRLFAAGATPPLRYTFTDVSPMFVERARRRFRDLPGFEYGTLDLDRAPEEQGWQPGSFDVVIGANCLHAARDLTSALAGMARMLRPGGVLLAPEVFAPHRWFDLTVGLTDGWWHFTDRDIRAEYACVSPAVWSQVLERAGFTDTHAFRLAAAAATDGLASRSQGLVLSFRTPVPATAQPWLLLHDDDALARGLASRLGDAVVCAPIADVDDAAVAALLQKHSHWSGVLFCPAPAADPSSPSALAGELKRVVGGLLSVGRALMQAGGAGVERLSLLTRAAQVTGVHDAEPDPVAAACWGLLRGIAAEVPGLACTSLDLERAGRAGDVDRVLAWLHAVDEPELAVRGEGLLAPRLQRRRPPEADVLAAEYRLVPDRRGSIDNLEFTSGERVAPGAGQIEIRVAASALNFKDVLNVLGLYPGDPGPLGSECAGVVTRVGSDVDHVRVGDEVIAAAGGAYGRHVIADSPLVARKPAALGFADAATLPIAYLTAHFALNHLGRMGPGDRVLIHAAAGGVGLAACHLALQAGAQVLATAGSDAKRALLRNLGIEHVFDSRSPSFVEGVRAATGGAGATVVLNSLADDFVEHTFAVTAAGARFLEIGKRGIWTHEQVAGLGRDIEYHIIDWGVTAREQPALMGALFADVIGRIERAELPALPFTQWPLERVRDAFRYMAQGKHTGKIVLAHPVQRSSPAQFRSDATYLITGGTTGLGLVTARWAVAQGAGTLVLASRRAPGEEALAALETLREAGADVHAWQLDVGDAAAVGAALQRIRAELPPLRGVIHGAGALSDRTLQHIEWSDFETVLRAKAYGCAALLDAVHGAELDFFVSYSSMASVFGSPGQSNHSAANAFLDACTARAWRAADCSMSIAWGPWSETGAAARSDVLRRNRDRGLEPLTTEQGRQWIERAFARPAALLIGARIERPELLGGTRNARLLQELAPAARAVEAAAPDTSAVQTASFADQLAGIPAGARRTFVVNRVKHRVRTVLGLPAESPLDADRPLGEMGLDSLLAIELRNVLGEDLGRRLPATLLFDHPTSAALADHLLSLLDVADAGAPVVVEAHAPDPLAAIDDLSDDDVDRLLAEKLGS